DQLLKEAAYSDDRKTASWLSANINPNNQWFVSPAKQGMYDGLGGISLFLLYLGNQTGEKKYLDAAEAAMNSALNPVMESKGLVSAFSGTYSLLYPLVH
ncbi:lanthionine synthetase LanC family protein, partial [Bacillus pumilus]